VASELVTLEVGSLAESVTVQGGAAEVDTSNGTELALEEIVYTVAEAVRDRQICPHGTKTGPWDRFVCPRFFKLLPDHARGAQEEDMGSPVRRALALDPKADHAAFGIAGVLLSVADRPVMTFSSAFQQTTFSIIAVIEPRIAGIRYTPSIW
jgi:hypothetical protein